MNSCLAQRRVLPTPSQPQRKRARLIGFQLGILADLHGTPIVGRLNATCIAYQSVRLTLELSGHRAGWMRTLWYPHWHRNMPMPPRRGNISLYGKPQILTILKKPAAQYASRSLLVCHISYINTNLTKLKT